MMAGRPPLSVVAWKWGTLFGAQHVNTLRSMLARHLHVDHQLYCVTDDARGIHDDVVIVPLPMAYSNTPRCRRRMLQYDSSFAQIVGPRMLAIDLDVVIVDDLTPLLDRPDPIVGYRVGHADVISGSFILLDTGALHGAFERFVAQPDAQWAQRGGVPSDQAMINHFLGGQPPIACWTEADGLITYYGRGYESREHYGVGPNRPALPAGARIVILGSADIDVLRDDSPFDWVRSHWR